MGGGDLCVGHGLLHAVGVFHPEVVLAGRGAEEAGVGPGKQKGWHARPRLLCPPEQVLTLGMRSVGPVVGRET